jgi:hypothetical protein
MTYPVLEIDALKYEALADNIWGIRGQHGQHTYPRSLHDGLGMNLKSNRLSGLLDAQPILRPTPSRLNPLPSDPMGVKSPEEWIPSKMDVECIGYPRLQGHVPIPRCPRNNVTREPRGDKYIDRLLAPETARLHPLLDSVLLLGLFTVWGSASPCRMSDSTYLVDNTSRKMHRSISRSSASNHS